MVVARNLSHVFEWVLDGTTFLLRTLPHRVMLRMGDMESADQLELIVRAGCAGWRDFADADGNVVASQTDGAANGKMIGGIAVKTPLTEASYEALPLQVISDLAMEVLRFNRMTADDSGNS